MAKDGEKEGKLKYIHIHCFCIPKGTVMCDIKIEKSYLVHVGISHKSQALSLII